MGQARVNSDLECFRETRHGAVFVFQFSIFALCALASVSLGSVVRAAAIEPPLVGRPIHAPFSGAVGSFHASTSATPTDLQAEDPLTLTIRLTADGQVSQPPLRPDLSELPAFAERFYIENVATPDESPTGRQGYEFVYRLKPRSATVHAIPSFPLVYYLPGMLPASKGFMTRWAPSIELNVRPREEVGATDLEGGKPLVGPPATVYQFVGGDAVLLHEQPPALPKPLSLALFTLAPPLGCLGWVLVWRRLNPDAARQARKQRSRAARRALKKLRAADQVSALEQAKRASAIVADYLRDRVEFPAAEPTPVEVATHLRRIGVPDPLVEQTVRFFQECDASRFRPSPAPGWSAAKDAIPLILALEDMPWSS